MYSRISAARYQLVREGADVENVRTDAGDTLLHWLTARDVLLENVKEIRELVELHPGLKDIEDPLGSTPIDRVLAIISLRVPVNIIEMLLSDQNLNKPLIHEACWWGNLPAAKFLHARGLSLIAVEYENRTVLHYAADGDWAKIVEWLLTHPEVVGWIDSTDVEGCTALHLAASSGSFSVAKLLLGKGARADLQNAQKKTAAQLIPDDLVTAFPPACFVTSNDKLRFMKSYIGSMDAYGKMLQDEGALAKGTMIVNLAAELTSKIDDFFALPPDTQQAHANTFRDDFIRTLNSKNNEMKAYRTNWETIIKNIAIALTGIGVVAIVAKLAYSKWTQGRALFFGQQEQTRSERNVASMRDSVKQLFPSPGVGA